MRRFAITIVLLYGAIILVLTVPVILGALYPGVVLKDAIKTFICWEYWVYLAVMLACQAALLGIPVKIESRRPVTKGPVIFTVAAAGFLGALLLWAAAGAVVETISKTPEMVYGIMSMMDIDPDKNPFLESAVKGSIAACFLLVWLIWGLIFFRWSRKLEPKAFIEKQCRALFAGSALELLIAVPTHIIARGRDYCCAGFSTFIGIAAGIAVMLISFGPGVFFLYLERWKKLHPQD